MAIDWDKFQSEMDELVIHSGERTDAALASQVSSITRLTDEEIQKMFPEPADVRKLMELMEIVKRSGEHNEKVNKLVANADQYAGVMLKLLATFV
jgi:hypothetical protein